MNELHCSICGHPIIDDDGYTTYYKLTDNTNATIVVCSDCAVIKTVQNLFDEGYIAAIDTEDDMIEVSDAVVIS